METYFDEAAEGRWSTWQAKGLINNRERRMMITVLGSMALVGFSIWFGLLLR
jgi:hypothetical protein